MKILKRTLGRTGEISTRIVGLGLLALFLAATSSVFAATQGPLSPTTCANTAGIGTKPWSPSPGIPESATLQANSNEVSNYLKCTGYGFTIPAGAIIDGITVTVNRSASRATMVQDAAMRIVKTGAIGATDKSNAAFWPTTAASLNYGSAADLWGTTWTVADINAANFGAAIAAIASNGSGNVTPTVTSITITVTYHTMVAPTVAKAFAPTTVATQVSSTLTITLSNSNATAITGAAFTDAYPAGLVNASTPAGTTTCAGGTVTAVAGGGSVALSGGTIPASGSCTVTVSVTSSTGGSYANNVPIGAVTSTNAPANTAASNTATLTVLNRPGVSKSFGTNPIVAGGTSTLTITLSNSNSVAITGAAFTDTYPAGVTNSSTASTTCGGTATATVGGGTVSLSGGIIPVSSSCTVTVTVTAASAGSYANSIAVGAVTSTNASSNSLAASDTLTVNAAVASFDAVEVGAAPHSNLFTKLSGVAFSVDILALNASNLVSSSYTGTVSLTLVDGSSSGICGSMTSLQALGNQTFTVGNAGRRTVSITYANAARNVRIRINDSSLGITTCSFDAFAIRPDSFATVSSNMTNTATTGAPSVTAGGNFTLTATAIVGYNGTPSIDATKIAAHAGATQTGAVAGAFSAAAPATGIATGAAFTYSEVGNFQFLAQGVYDDTFTAVDQPNDCTNNFSNALAGGKYGCIFGTSAATSFFGRFIPANFTVASVSLTNRSGLCAPASAFTYMGEPIALAFTLTAKNAAGTTTQNYTTASGFAQLNPAAPKYFNFVTKDTVQTSLRTFAISAISRANPGQVTTSTAHGFVTGQQIYVTGVNGMTQINGQLVTVTVVNATNFTIGIDTTGYGIYTSSGTASRLAGLTSSGTWIAGAVGVNATVTLQRAVSPDGPYTALTVGIAPRDDDGITLLAGLLNFDADNNAANDSYNVGTTETRFGRLRVGNVFGSTLLDLPLSLTVEFFNANGVFTTNPDDSCTTLAASNIRMAFVAGTPNLVACETALSPTGIIYFNAGKASAVAPPSAVSAPKLTKPGITNDGAVDLAVNLNGASGGSTCAPTATAVTNASKPWLQGNWSGGAYTADPAGRATFGIFKNSDQFLYLREIY